MKKVFFVIAVGMFFMCTANIKTSEKPQDKVNYIPYFLKAEQAVKLYKNSKFDESYRILDSLFNHYEPKNTLALNESSTFLKLCVKLRKIHNAEKVIKYFALKEGWDYSSFEGDIQAFMVKNTRYKASVILELNKQHRIGLIRSLGDSLGVMFDRDQAVRQPPVDEKALLRVNAYNGRQLINIIKKYGFPTPSQVDDLRKVANISVMLKHLTVAEKLEIQPILLEELKNGKVAPWIYASMLDKETAASHDIGFPYYGTYADVKPKDTTACNNARETIGLPRIIF